MPEEIFHTAVQDELYAVREYAIRAGALYAPQRGSAYKYRSAHCATHLHQAPGNHCTCGYYCYSLGAFDGAQPYGGILALVRIEGRVVIGTQGYRAERLRIMALNCARSDLSFDLWPRGTGRNTIQAFAHRRLMITFIPNKRQFLMHLKEYADPESITRIREVHRAVRDDPLAEARRIVDGFSGPAAELGEP